MYGRSLSKNALNTGTTNIKQLDLCNFRDLKDGKDCFLVKYIYINILLLLYRFKWPFGALQKAVDIYSLHEKWTQRRPGCVWQISQTWDCQSSSIRNTLKRHSNFPLGTNKQSAPAHRISLKPKLEWQKDHCPRDSSPVSLESVLNRQGHKARQREEKSRSQQFLLLFINNSRPRVWSLSAWH